MAEPDDHQRLQDWRRKEAWGGGGDLKKRRRMKDVSESKLLGQETIKQMLL